MLSPGVKIRTFVPKRGQRNRESPLKKVHLFYQNVRGLRSKTSVFINNVVKNKFDIIALTETFLTSSVCNGELFPPEYTVVRKDRAGDIGWGGVLLAVRDCYSVRIISNIANLTVDKELLFAIVSHKDVKFLCCVVYLPPNYNDEQYLNVLTCIEDVICTYSDLAILIIGDFNLNSCSANVKMHFNLFCDFCLLKQHNSVFNYRGVMLDLVLSDLELDNISVTISHDPLVHPDNHHPALEVDINFPRHARVPNSVSPPTQSSALGPDFNWRKGDLHGLYIELANIDWSDLLAMADVNSTVELFYNKLYDCIKRFVPIKTHSTNGSRYTYPTWFTAEIIKNIKQKYFHLKRYKQEGKEFNLELFKYYREHVKNLIDIEYRRHINVIGSRIIDDPVQFWNYIKDKKKQRQCVDTFSHHGVDMQGQEAANSFAKYFSSVFRTDVPRLDHVDAARVAHSLSDSLSISISSVDEDDLKRAVKRLKPRSSEGPDRIPVFLARDCVSILSAPLLHIFNLSLSKGTYPVRWKLSRVTPVPKSVGATDVPSFRPIAVLSVFPKTFEIILNNHISDQISNLLHDSQHGFRKARSTTTNLVAHVDYVAAEMDRGHQVDVAYFDFRKAFDLVDNDILLQKLATIGFTPSLLKLMACYLNNRCQYVRLNGYESEVYYTRSGVSQGSTLGPTLFLIFVNDLPRCVEEAKCLLFADDLKLSLSIVDDSDTNMLQQDVDSVWKWSQDNNLPLNSDKCKVITCSRKRQPLHATYYMSNAPLERVSNIRDLGLEVDTEFDFHTHITIICKQASKMLGFVIRTAAQFDNPKVAVVLYTAFVRSKLEYGAVIWDPHEHKYALLVEKIQRKFARWLYKQHYGYYPYLYPSMFVSGMVDLETLKFRRLMLLLKHYLSIIHHKIDNPVILEQIRLMVPRNIPRDADGLFAPRRRPRLLARPTTRTKRAEYAPTTRALRCIGDLLAQHNDIDIFFDQLGHIINKFHLYLNDVHID